MGFGGWTGIQTRPDGSDIRGCLTFISSDFFRKCTNFQFLSISFTSLEFGLEFCMAYIHAITRGDTVANYSGTCVHELNLNMENLCRNTEIYQTSIISTQLSCTLTTVFSKTKICKEK